MKIVCCLLQAWLSAAVLLSGAAEAESLDEGTLERFESLSEHPVPLNLASRSRLLASGLLTPYQVASLSDYRARSGDILSLEELALIDGFSREVAEALAPFVSLRSAALPGVPDSLQSPVHQVLEFRSKGPSVKYRLCLGDRAEAGLAWRENAPGGAYGVYYGRGRLGKIVAGRLNVRFGQGLAAWTGVVIEDLLSPSSFVRKGSGVSPSRSYSGDGTLLGVAADFSLGHFDLTAYAVDSGAGANAGWCWRGGRIGASVVLPGYGSLPRLSTDIRCNIRGVQLFAECAGEPAKGRVAAVGGLLSPIGEHFQTALRLTAIPSAYSRKKNGEYGVAGAVGYSAGGHKAAMAASYSALPVPETDPGRYLLKLRAQWGWQITPAWDLSIRVAQRWRNYSGESSRTDLRLDGGFTGAQWWARGRVNGVWCDGGGILSYLEGGIHGRLISVSLRGTVFRTAAWASRVYSYERDAPGNFNVPAYYGKGWAATLLVGSQRRWRHTTLKIWGRLYILNKESGAVPGLSIQLQLSIWGS